MNIDDVSVQLQHIVCIVQVDVDLFGDFTVERSEFFNGSGRGEDEESGLTYEHERCHDEVNRQEEKDGKYVFEYTLFQVTETKGFREEDMLQVSHVSCGKEEELFIESEEMMLLYFGVFPLCEQVKYLSYLRGTVDLGDHVERAGRVENECWNVFQRMQLFQYTPDGTVPTVDDNIVIILNIVVFWERGCIDGSNVQILMFQGFSYGKKLHTGPLILLGYNYSHEN